MDFSLQKYMELLDMFRSERCPVLGVEAWLNCSPPAGILMRHDIDRLPLNALKMAEAESARKIQTTYYFRIKNSTFKPDIIRKVADLGHEVGYHYEDLTTAAGDIQQATALFAENLRKFRKITPVRTVCMHGSPLSRHDNRLLAAALDLDTFGLVGDAFESVNYGDMYYFTDTGRRWDDEAANIRDRVSSLSADCEIQDTDQLILLLHDLLPCKAALVIHPERWAFDWQRWVLYFVLDLGSNFLKRFLHSFHLRRSYSLKTTAGENKRTD